MRGLGRAFFAAFLRDVEMEANAYRDSRKPNDSVETCPASIEEWRNGSEDTQT